MRVWRTFSRFACTAEEYFDLMLDVPFQERLHVDGLGMGTYQADDTLEADGTYRVAFAEPRLNLPAVLARLFAKAQAYHEHTHYDPVTLERHVRVVPALGAEHMDFTFTETVRADRDGVGGCVATSVVRVHCDGGWLGRVLERFICSTSKVKLGERDAYLNAYLEREMGTYARERVRSGGEPRGGTDEQGGLREGAVLAPAAAEHVRAERVGAGEVRVGGQVRALGVSLLTFSSLKSLAVGPPNASTPQAWPR